MRVGCCFIELPIRELTDAIVGNFRVGATSHVHRVAGEPRREIRLFP